MRRSSRALGFALFGLGLAGVVEACGASNADQPPPDVAGSAGTSGSGNMDATTVTPEDGGQGGVGQPDYDPSCGIAPRGCVPDDENSCSAFRPGTSGAAGSGGLAGTGGSSGGRGGRGGSSGESGGGLSGEPAGAGEAGQAGAAGEGGQGESGGPTSSEGGQPTTGGGRSGGGGTSGGPVDAGAPVFACGITLLNGAPRAACAEAGPGEVNAPCLSGSDCKPALACVGDTAGRCRPYCCEHDACNAFHGTHCVLETLVGVASDSTEPALRAPVCVPAVECNLAEDYPCTGGACTCPEGTACSVVSDNGTTSCVVPGKGREGDPCPCAWGHVCSQATNQCVKLCQTAAPSDDCGSGRCQASPALPLGWGVCVGHEPTDAG